MRAGQGGRTKIPPQKAIPTLPEPMTLAARLTRSFAGGTVIDALSMNIADGEIFGLLWSDASLTMIFVHCRNGISQKANEETLEVQPRDA